MVLQSIPEVITGSQESLLTTVIDAIAPFQVDDGHKGTFLLLRIAGIDQGVALKIIDRKWRSWKNWIYNDPQFRAINDKIDNLTQKFGGEARVIRTAMLDAHIIETGISIFKKILERKKGTTVSSDEWSYVTKLAGIRMPMMSAKLEGGSPWARLANVVKNTIEQRELTIKSSINGSGQVITARETIVGPSLETQRAIDDIISEAVGGGK